MLLWQSCCTVLTRLVGWERVWGKGSVMAGECSTRADCKRSALAAYQRWTPEKVAEVSQSDLWHPPDAFVQENERRLLIRMPASYGYDVVQRSSTETEEEARDLIRSTLEDTRAAARQAQLFWWVRPSTRPANMADLLSEFGFSLAEEVEILYLDLGVGEEPVMPPMPESPIIYSIARSDQEFVAAHRLRLESIGDGEASPNFEELQRDLSTFDESREAGFVALDRTAAVELVAWKGDLPIATAGIWVGECVGHLWGAATSPQYRRRGVYQTLVRARCEIAYSLGADLVLSKARRGTSGPVLVDLGFVRAGVQLGYVRDLR